MKRIHRKFPRTLNNFIIIADKDGFVGKHLVNAHKEAVPIDLNGLYVTEISDSPTPQIKITVECSSVSYVEDLGDVLNERPKNERGDALGRKLSRVLSATRLLKKIWPDKRRS